VLGGRDEERREVGTECVWRGRGEGGGEGKGEGRGAETLLSMVLTPARWVPGVVGDSDSEVRGSGVHGSEAHLQSHDTPGSVSNRVRDSEVRNSEAHEEDYEIPESVSTRVHLGIVVCVRDRDRRYASPPPKRPAIERCIRALYLIRTLHWNRLFDNPIPSPPSLSQNSLRKLAVAFETAFAPLVLQGKLVYTIWAIEQVPSTKPKPSTL
jgi:hypothetical protein